MWRGGWRVPGEDGGVLPSVGRVLLVSPWPRLSWASFAAQSGHAVPPLLLPAADFDRLDGLERELYNEVRPEIRHFT